MLPLRLGEIIERKCPLTSRSRTRGKPTSRKHIGRDDASTVITLKRKHLHLQSHHRVVTDDHTPFRVIFKPIQQLDILPNEALGYGTVSVDHGSGHDDTF